MIGRERLLRRLIFATVGRATLVFLRSESVTVEVGYVDAGGVVGLTLAVSEGCCALTAVIVTDSGIAGGEGGAGLSHGVGVSSATEGRCDGAIVAGFALPVNIPDR